MVLTFGDKGWDKGEVHILAGGTVVWRAGSVSWAGTPVLHLWVMDASYNTLNDLDISGGTASLRFTKPGKYRYCAGGCWDPPDFGVVVVE